MDTDAGADDLMALALLLSRPDIQIEAVTVVNGVAHVPAGARNILALLALAGHANIPVYAGRETPLAGGSEFPAAWRDTADKLPGVSLPNATQTPQSESASQFLAMRLADTAHPSHVLALGPLTNLAEALEQVPAEARRSIQITAMGGALHVPGNLRDADAPPTENSTAEWNFFVDPAAAAKVISLGASERMPRGLHLRLVPLDATNQVPIDAGFVMKFTGGAPAGLAKAVAQLLEVNRAMIEAGSYRAWDPLAAMTLFAPAVATYRCLAVQVNPQGPEAGRTVESPHGTPNLCAAVSADPKVFSREFFATFAPQAAAPSQP